MVRKSLLIKKKLGKKMKKLNLLFAVICASLFLAGCSKAAPDANGFYNDFDAAMSAAKKAEQSILLIVTAEGDVDYAGNDYSTPFMNNCVRTEDFKKTILSDYTIAVMDFSESTYMKTVVGEELSGKEKKEAKKNASQLEKNSVLVSKLNPEYAPAVYLFTKEGYYIGTIAYVESISNTAEFKDILDTHKETVDLVNELVADTKKGSNADKLKVIDKLFMATPSPYRVFLYDLVNQAISFDKKNESGLMAKYVMAKADYEAIELTIKGNVPAAAKKYAEIAENPMLNPLEKQQSYYMAAYTLGISGSSEVSQVLGYLQESMNACPEGETYEQIKATYDYYVEAAAQASQAYGMDFDPESQE